MRTLECMVIASLTASCGSGTAGSSWSGNIGSHPAAMLSHGLDSSTGATMVIVFSSLELDCTDEYGVDPPRWPRRDLAVLLLELAVNGPGGLTMPTAPGVFTVHGNLLAQGNVAVPIFASTDSQCASSYEEGVCSGTVTLTQITPLAGEVDLATFGRGESCGAPSGRVTGRFSAMKSCTALGQNQTCH